MKPRVPARGRLPKTLQDGIYLLPGISAPAAWRAVLLDTQPEASARDVRQAVQDVMAMLADLRRGIVRELTPSKARQKEVARVPVRTFSCLLGYGASFWDSDSHKPPLTEAGRPTHLVALHENGPAFPNLPWSGSRTAPERGEADLFFQFTGVSEQAVDRAAVEVWKLIEDRGLPLAIVASFDGFQRDDARSWIGFHDGVNNIEPSQRPAAVVSRGEPQWNEGGTYLAFLRIDVSLTAWRALSVGEQEVLVGREKISGCPLETARVEDGEIKTQALACSPTDRAWLTRDQYFNPPETAEPLIEASHIHRANQNRAAGTASAGHRIFRQGYEYLEGFEAGEPRLGLNFVSFQNDLFHFHQILGLENWLGGVNFGGPADPKEEEPEPLEFLTLRAGGLYAVPPRGDPFPGADLFAV